MSRTFGFGFPLIVAIQSIDSCFGSHFQLQVQWESSSIAAVVVAHITKKDTSMKKAASKPNTILHACSYSESKDIPG
jgi:hypothetical protein